MVGSNGVTFYDVVSKGGGVIPRCSFYEIDSIGGFRGELCRFVQTGRVTGLNL